MPAAESTRFHVDLLHPGRVSRSWQDWVTGARGRPAPRPRHAGRRARPARDPLRGRAAGVPAPRGRSRRGAGADARPGRPRYRPAPAPLEPPVPLSGGPPPGALGRRPDDPESADPSGAQAAARRGGADGPAGRREPAHRRDVRARPRQGARRRRCASRPSPPRARAARPSSTWRSSWPASCAIPP